MFLCEYVSGKQIRESTCGRSSCLPKTGETTRLVSPIKCRAGAIQLSVRPLCTHVERPHLNRQTKLRIPQVFAIALFSLPGRSFASFPPRPRNRHAIPPPGFLPHAVEMKARNTLVSVLLTAVGTETRRLEKRDYYTCYLTAPSAINSTDCDGVIAEVRSRTGAFSVVPNLCLVWMHGSCKARLCAVDDDTTTSALNRSYRWVGDQLDDLQRQCASNGQDGMRGDCGNLNGYCGTYRLFLEHRGPSSLNISGAGVA